MNYLHTRWTSPSPSRLHSQPCGFYYPFCKVRHYSLEQLSHPAPRAAWPVRCFPGTSKMCFEAYWTELGAEPRQKLSCWVNTGKETSWQFFKGAGAVPLLCWKQLESTYMVRPFSSQVGGHQLVSLIQTQVWDKCDDLNCTKGSISHLCNSSRGNAQKHCSSCSLIIYQSFTQIKQFFSGLHAQGTVLRRWK